MPSDFHLSIKNNQRKIVDVRDLFKDLTETESNILELAKKRSELEKLRKEANEVLFNKDLIQAGNDIYDIKNLPHSKYNPQLYENQNIDGVKYRKKKSPNDINEAKHYSMFDIEEPTLDFAENSEKDLYNRCFSQSNVNYNMQMNNKNYQHHYNIIQKVSSKRPPRPKTLVSSSASTSTDQISSSSDTSNNSSPIKTKVIRIHSRVPPKVSPKPQTQGSTPIVEENYERRHFFDIKNKFKNFLIVDKKFSKYKVNTSKPFYVNVQPNNSSIPINESQKINKTRKYVPNLCKNAEPISLFYIYNKNESSNNNYNSKIHVGNQHCHFGQYPTNIVESQPHQQYHQDNYHQHEQLFNKHREYQQPTAMPTIDRFSAFFNRTKNFRF